jgi:hypothetical protein
MDEALPVMREVIEALLRASEMSDVPRDFRNQAERFLQSGDELRRNFLAHAHGSASPLITPDLLELAERTNEWFGTASVLIESASGLRAAH